MPRYLIAFSLLLCALAACSPQEGAIDIQQALQVAEAVREGCVAENLTMMVALADRFSPLCEARDLEHLIALTAVPGCTIVPGVTSHTLDCVGVQVGESVLDLHAELTFLGADGAEGVDPRDATALRVSIQAVGLDGVLTGELTCTPDPARGLVLDGTLDTLFFEGFRVATNLRDLTAQRLADAASSLLFTSGSIDIAVDDVGDPVATGTAAVIGRHALVALEVHGVYSQGEIQLGQ